MLVGDGSPHRALTDDEVVGLCARALEGLPLANSRVLAVVPDNTRTAPIDLMFRTVYRLLEPAVRQFDVLIALGTHAPLSALDIYRRVGLTAEQHRSQFPKARFFNHAWQDPERLTVIGTLDAAELETISGGRMRRDVPVSINRMALEYDLVLIIGPVFPHEVVGFSGGNKYLFPGISGQEIIDAFHWLGALIQSAVVIGTADTPVRAVIDRAAAMLRVEKLCMALVVDTGGLAGLFIGSPDEAWRAAADLSARLHVVRKDAPFTRVLSCVPEMYPELWTGAKGMYKLEPVVADGGELVIFAPHIRDVSSVHGALIERIGYHVRDYFLAQMDRFSDVPGGVLAHSTHVKGMGSFEGGIEVPRIGVTLATGIPRATCERINLGYRDPKTIDVADWRDREDAGILYVPRAGERLYRLRDDPFQCNAGDRPPGVSPSAGRL